MNWARVTTKNAIALTFMLSVPLGAARAEVIFEEDFDDQPDFTSTMHSTSSQQAASEGHILPEGWTDMYQTTQWSPETGFPENHASLEILKSNSDKARGGRGASAVNWRESYSTGRKNWASDSQLIKYLGTQYKQLYVEFYVRFSPDFYGREHASGFQSKLFRVGHWSGQGNIYSGYRGDIGPMFIWQYKRDNYGVRNVLSFRGGPPYSGNYQMGDEYDKSPSLNYGSHTEGEAIDGSDPLLVDQVNGGYLIDRGDEVIGHNQVFGEGANWTRVSFFVRTNSAPGVKDGVLRQWINGVLITNRTQVPWVLENEENKMVGWNYFAIGGNDYFQPYPNEQRFEDWYSIDDVMVSTEVPEGLGEEGAAEALKPNPPSDVTIE